MAMVWMLSFALVAGFLSLYFLKRALNTRTFAAFSRYFLVTLFLAAVFHVFFHERYLPFLVKWWNSTPISNIVSDNDSFLDSRSCSSRNINLPRDDYKTKHLAFAKSYFNNMFMEDDSKREYLIASGKLVELKPDEGFQIDEFSSSSAHLEKRSYDILKELGRLFQSELKASGIKRGIFRVHSGTRTETEQQEIRRKNPRTAARDTSTHNFGLSIDISRVEVDGNPKVALKCLRTAILHLRNRNKLFVCPESTNLHLTFVPISYR